MPFIFFGLLRLMAFALYEMKKKKDGELFVGTVADFSGMDPLIYREPLRTEQYDATNLNGMSNSIPFSLVYDDVHIF